MKIYKHIGFKGHEIYNFIFTDKLHVKTFSDESPQQHSHAVSHFQCPTQWLYRAEGLLPKNSVTPDVLWTALNGHFMHNSCYEMY